jgi:hypothetical protein
MEQAMDSLPTANAELTRFFHHWLDTFAAYVRDVDYASARPLFHRDVLAFGTHNDVIPGIDQWIATQWDHVWPKTADFHFVLEQTSVLASPDGRMAIVIAPWTSTGYHADGKPFPRPPRHPGVFKGRRRLALHAFPHVAEPRRAADEPWESTGEGVLKGPIEVRPHFALSFRDGPKDQTSDAQLRIGESRDSPMCNCTS